MHIFGFFSAIIIGFVLGLIGGGGSILSVPVFVYLFEMDVVTATTLSLFVVGITSAVGSVGFIRKGFVSFPTALRFGIPSILGILFSRRVVVPHLPDYIINRWGITMSKDLFILLVFCTLMLISAIKMIQKNQRPRLRKDHDINYTLLASQGLLVGIVTGFVGAGGGFLIVPALVMLLGVNMKEAVATSLFIIAINSLIGFASSLDKVSVDWEFLLAFSAIAVIGILIGGTFAKRMDGKKLKPLFGWFVLIMGLWIVLNELVFKYII